jgi:hypothetical protein
MKNKVTGTRLWTAIAAVVILMAAASPARAEQRMIANVPFDFIVGHSRLPAGHYIVTEADDPALVSIANTDGHAFTFVLTIAGSNDQTASEPELVFKQYGGQRFLAQIVTTETEEREIPLKESVMAENVDRVALASFR